MSLDDMNTDPLPRLTRLTGVIVLRTALAQRAAPPSYALCDPAATFPVLALTIERQQAAAGGRASDPPNVPWQRCQLQLWGLWADRLAQSATPGCSITVVGAEVEASPGASGFGSAAWQLALPPLGANSSASVMLVSGSGANVGATTYVCAKGVQYRAAPMQHNAAPAAGGPDPKRPRANSYDYLSVHDISQPRRLGAGCAGSTPDAANVFAVVLEYQLPRATRTRDLRSVLHLVDESCEATGRQLVVSFFKAHPHVPAVGSVVRLHRVKRGNEYQGVWQALAFAGTQWVVGDGAAADANRSAAKATWTAANSARVAALRRWAREHLSTAGPFSTFRNATSSLAAAHAHAAAVETPRPGGPVSLAEVFVDLLVRLAPFPDLASVAAAYPSKHGVGSRAPDGRPLPLAVFSDAEDAGAAGAVPMLAPLYVTSTLACSVTLLLLRHLRSRPAATAAAGQTSLDPFDEVDLAGAPIGGDAAAADGANGDGAARSRGDGAEEDAFAGRWVRLRGVVVRRHQGGGLSIIYTENSAVMHLPDYHAEVVRLRTIEAPNGLAAGGGGAGGSLAGAPLADAAPLPLLPAATAATRPAAAGANPPPGFGQFGDASAGAQPSTLGRAQPCTLTRSAGAAPSSSNAAAELGQPPGAGTWAPAESRRSPRKHPTSGRCEAVGPLAAPLAPRHPARPAEALSTTLFYPGLELWTVAQAQDRAPSAPAAFRLRASVSRVLPTLPVSWIARAPGRDGVPHEYTYRLVLQLADESATLGAILDGPEAEHFFAGLRPCDLRESNVSRAVLERRVEAMCSGTVLEFCVVSYRPEPDRDAWSLRPPHHDVAYRIVGTELHCCQSPPVGPQ